MELDFYNYQRKSERTINKKLNKEDMILNACLGISGETGEVVDHIKKYFYQGHQLDLHKVAEELGDVLWYIAEICTALHINLDVVAQQNIEKLEKRYPEKFTEEASINRKE